MKQFKIKKTKLYKLGGTPQYEESPNPQEINALLGLFAEGRYAEAATLAQTMTARFPFYGFGWKVFGAALKQMKDPANALAPMRKASELLPDDAESHSNLGVTLRSVGRPDEAEASLRRALQIKPDFAEGYSNLALTFRDLARPEEAEASLRRALQVKPDYAEGHSNLALILRDLGWPDEAEASFRRALQVKPDFAEGHSNLALILRDLARPDEAEASLRRALQIEPDCADAHNDLAITLRELGLPDEAEKSYRQALQINPDYGKVHANLAITLRELGRLDEAKVSYQRALEIEPGHAEVYNNLGATLMELGWLDEAEVSFRRALQLKRDFAGAHSNLLLGLNYHSRFSPEEIFAKHQEWDALQTGEHELVKRFGGDRNPHRRLRVGYVSPDLRRHSVAYFFEPLLREHDRQFVEVFCYADVARADPVTERMKKLSDRWLRTAGMSNKLLARHIADDNIDILVDLAGHTAHNRLPVFAQKPAPVQVTWLGYPHSSGLRAMDYRFVDAVTDPVSEGNSRASESLVRLDNSFLCYAAPAEAPQISDPPCLASGRITFGSFNNPNKLSAATLDAWAMLLARVPTARLLVKGSSFLKAGNKKAILEEFTLRGIDVERIVLLAQVPALAVHLGLYAEVDIALDPFPYNGTTTTCEALWMGVPVVTLRGDRHAGRVGASLLTQIGLKEMIAISVHEYVDIAAALAEDIVGLVELRRNLRARMAASPLCNAPAFARKIEVAYRNMWQRYCARVDRITLPLDCGVRIVVPNSLELITPYVIQEQRDWFEDEIRFLRHLLLPGQKVIDIGANYGVYTLSMARTLGPNGRVWAFEPASETAEFLAEGIAVNGLVQIVLERTALSCTCGKAQLSLHGHSELNALSLRRQTTTPNEMVVVVTLDECLERYGWRDIDFIKIDAEGEEANILKGGRRFFCEMSPLVQYEIRAGAELHMELVQHFAELGYSSYRLVPGLDLLVPFDANSSPDNFLLNLFCCKQDRIKGLAARGYSLDADPDKGSITLKDMVKHATYGVVYDWRHTITQLPYGARLANIWECTMAEGNCAEVERAISLYFVSRDATRSSFERFSALEACFCMFRSLCSGRSPSMHLASLARVARDYGARSIAVDALQELSDAILQHKEVDLTEPFLAPSQRFDTLSPGNNMDSWILAAVLEELERLGSYSSFFTKASARERLELIHSLGFGSAEMERRLYLLNKRFHLQDSKAGEDCQAA